MQRTEEEGKFRHLTGFFERVERVFLIAIPSIGILFLLDIHMYLGQALFKEQYLAIFLGLVLASIFLGVPATRGISRYHLPWYDVALAGISLGICLYFSVTYPQYLLEGLAAGKLAYLILSTPAILLVAEATRRMTGWVLVGLVGAFIFYARFTYLFPAPFFGNGVPWKQLSVYLVLDSAGMFGLPLWVVGAIVFGFILLGEFLFFTGGSQLLNDLSLAITGRFRGGPAKVAVVSSSLFGTISGSVVANVAATGVMTIPMMKATGYKSTIAGAIEASASTGGQLLPPVMGIAAFLIAEFLGISYAEVAIAAVIPAALYYFALFMQVDLEAAKTGLTGLSGKLPRIWPLLKKSWLFFPPVVVLVYTLFILNFQPGKASIAAIVSLVVLSLLTRETRKGLWKLPNILERAGRGLLMIGTITAVAGIIIGTIYITGMGTILSTFLATLGEQSLLIMLLTTAVLCIIMGMGMPTAAIYIILAVIVAPSLVSFGVLPIAAHLFIFYFGMMSMITPPICFAAYAAAAIAKTSPTKTGFYASRFGIAAYLVPFIFVYSPALLLESEIQDILLVVAKSLVGLSFLSVALSGFLFRSLGWGKRILIALGAIALLMPPISEIPIATWLLNMVGAALAVIIVFWEWRQRGYTPIST